MYGSDVTLWLLSGDLLKIRDELSEVVRLDACLLVIHNSVQHHSDFYNGIERIALLLTNKGRIIRRTFSWLELRYERIT